jgi:ankyrin repeat protein
MGTKKIIDAIKENDPIKLQKALDFFKKCINKDYDLNQAVQRGQKLLHIAVQHGSKAALSHLLNLNVDINITNDEGNTPAHYAVKYKQPVILEFLKNNGADFSKKNNDGYTLEEYIQIQPKKEENIRIKTELENILMDNSALAILADVAVAQAENPLKRKRTEQGEMHPKATKLSFFHNLLREIEYETKPLDLVTHDKPLNLSIKRCF